MLVELIDRINDALGAGTNVATIRSQLSSLREQTEAVEARVQQLEAEAQNKDFKQERDDLQARLDEANREIEKLRKQTGELEDDAVKMLDLLFKNGDMTIEGMAQTIGIERGMAEYHRDVLAKKELIVQTTMGFQGFGAMGDWVDSSGLYGLTSSGRAFIVRLKGK